MHQKIYYVYILTTTHHKLFYTGVTNSIERRVLEHKTKVNAGFTAKYNCTKLVYIEEHNFIVEAIHREKLIKKYSRQYKRNLVESINPEWKDLSDGWYHPEELKRMDE